MLSFPSAEAGLAARRVQAGSVANDETKPLLLKMQRKKTWMSCHVATFRDDLPSRDQFVCPQLPGFERGHFPYLLFPQCLASFCTRTTGQKPDILEKGSLQDHTPLRVAPNRAMSGFAVKLFGWLRRSPPRARTLRVRAS